MLLVWQDVQKAKGQKETLAETDTEKEAKENVVLIHLSLCRFVALSLCHFVTCSCLAPDFPRLAAVALAASGCTPTDDVPLCHLPFALFCAFFFSSHAMQLNNKYELCRIRDQQIFETFSVCHEFHGNNRMKCMTEKKSQWHFPMAGLRGTS